MHLNISQLNKKVQKRGPESQFQMISTAKPIEAGVSKLSEQLTHTHLLQTWHLNHLLQTLSQIFHKMLWLRSEIAAHSVKSF